MQSLIGTRSLRALGQAVAAFMVLSVHLAMAWIAGAGLESGVYQILPGATVEERGDRVPNGSRVVPFSTTLTFDLGATPPSLTAVISNAVLEGGNPFTLTVRSSTGEQFVDGTFRFTGDYLRDIYPSGTQYGFDWRFSSTNDGSIMWNGAMAWYGGHLWMVTISNRTIVPEVGPGLSISLREGVQVQATWSTNFADYVLEYSTNIPVAAWALGTNVPVVTNGCLAVQVEASGARRFFRLHKR